MQNTIGAFSSLEPFPLSWVLSYFPLANFNKYLFSLHEIKSSDQISWTLRFLIAQKLYCYFQGLTMLPDVLINAAVIMDLWAGSHYFISWENNQQHLKLLIQRWERRISLPQVQLRAALSLWAVHMARQWTAGAARTSRSPSLRHSFCYRWAVPNKNTTRWSN